MLTTKLYIPPSRAIVVHRPRLIERLNTGLHSKLTLISAPAGFGKTTLVGEWLAASKRPTAWLSLDAGDNDPTRFLTYLVAALQTLAPHIGASVLGGLQSPQPAAPDALLTALVNDIAALPDGCILVLDDYHVINARPIDQALTFLLERLPPQMHLVIVTREDPRLPLARLRARGQLSELRVADLRFTTDEAAGFLNQVMGLSLSTEDIAALETRTEGWIAGLQLAAISLQGHRDTSSFIQSFTGSHRFVMDYLLEEVLHRQPDHIQQFLLRTSILDRMCGPLCDTILERQKVKSKRQKEPQATDLPFTFYLLPSQQVLEHLDRSNLFLVPLDDERRWYRYHHLFADLLRQRLRQSIAASPEDAAERIAELHRRASVWYEDNRLEVEAFQHATAAHDVERAERLIEGNGMPLHFRGAVAPVLNWLKTTPPSVLDARPSLWTTYASVLLVTGQTPKVEQTLQSAEAALQGAERNDKTRDLIGRVAAIRATLAATLNQVESVIDQSRRALEYLHPNNLAFRTSTMWKLGYAYYLQGDRAAASQAYTEVISIGQATGNVIFTLMAMIGLGVLQEADNQLHLAAQTYRHALQLMGATPPPAAGEAYLGMARISYEWNDLDAAHQYVQQSLDLARQIENTDRVVAAEVFLTRLQLAQGDVADAATRVAQVAAFVRRHAFTQRMPEVAAAQALVLLRQGNLSAAAQAAHTHDIPLSQARVYLAQGDPAAALAVLEPARRQMEAKGWEDERLKVMLLQALAFQAHGQQDQAVQLLGDALAPAQLGGFIRSFVDEGKPMAQLLAQAAARGMMPGYIGALLAACDADAQQRSDTAAPRDQPLVEPLSLRELEILQLIAQGLSNQAISERLFLALSTVKGHNQRIFDKLQVQRRTEAIARARELGLL
jgi:LuxR family maltose regulon positive regulatory protein